MQGHVYFTFQVHQVARSTRLELPLVLLHPLFASSNREGTKKQRIVIVLLIIYAKYFRKLDWSKAINQFSKIANETPERLISGLLEKKAEKLLFSRFIKMEDVFITSYKMSDTDRQ